MDLGARDGKSKRRVRFVVYCSIRIIQKGIKHAARLARQILEVLLLQRCGPLEGTSLIEDNEVHLFMDKSKAVSRACIDSLYVFLRNFWDVTNVGDEYKDNWHIRKQCDLLTEQIKAYVAGGEYHREIIANVPPGTSKSTIWSVMLPVWCWLHAPHWTVIVTSYGSPVIDHSLKSRDIVTSFKFRYLFDGYYKARFGNTLRLTKNTEKDWRTTLGGQRLSFTTGGAATGKHGHLIIRDDPMSQAGAKSKAKRQQVHGFNDTTLPSRKKDKESVPTYTVMQRLHEDDTTGHELEKRPDIYHIKLPATIDNGQEVKPASWARYYHGGYLDPVRLSKTALASQLTDLGSIEYSCQYDQEPSSGSDGILKASWMVVSSEARSYNGGDLWIDGAYTANTANDPTGIALMKSDGGKLYIGKMWLNEYLELPELIKRVVQLCERYDIRKVYIEPKASGKSLGQMLNKIPGINCVEIKSYLVSKSKTERANVISAPMEAGKVVFQQGNYVEDAEYQLTRFPRAKHDEAVDLVGYGVDHYLSKRKKRRGVTIRG